MAGELTALGQALAGGARDYANIGLARDAENRRREQQLADVLSQRQYADSTDARRRGEQLQNITIEALVSSRFLAPDQVNNPEAIARASQEYQAFSNQERERNVQSASNAQSELNQLAVDRATLTDEVNRGTESLARLQKDYSDLSARAEGIEVRPADIIAEALRLAEAEGKTVPTKEPKRTEFLQQYVPSAQKTLEDASNMAAYNAQRRMKLLQDQYQAQVQEQNSRARRLDVVSDTMRNMQREFKIAPVRPVPPAETLMQPASVSAPEPQSFQSATDKDRAAARDGISHHDSPGAPPINTPSPVPDPQEYGGLMGLFKNNFQPEARLLYETLSNPAAAAEIGLRSATQGPARLLNSLVGGKKRIEEGDAERAAGMRSAIERFNTPFYETQQNPFLTGEYGNPYLLPGAFPAPPSKGRR